MSFDGPSKPRAFFLALLNFFIFYFFLVLVRELFPCHDIKCQRCCFLGRGGKCVGCANMMLGSLGK